MEDIAPELLRKIQEAFRRDIETSVRIKNVLDKLKAGTATYEDAQVYAGKIGQALTRAFKHNLSAELLPDGRMYYNIAERVLAPMLEESYSRVAATTERIQQSLNKNAGIGLKARRAALNEDRVKGIVDKVSNAESFEDVQWVLDAPVENFCRNVVDETLKANAEFHGKSGLNPRIIRKAESRCCKWCSQLEGEYLYDEGTMPEDIFRRHERCRCLVTYDPADGSNRRQNVHTKKWTTAEELDRIEVRKRFSDLEEGTELKTTPQKIVSENWNNAYGSSSWDISDQHALWKEEYSNTENPYEEAFAHDSKGNLFFRKEGNNNSVKFTDDEIQQLNGAVFTHNHPGGGCFSPNDINFMRYGHLSEMRATTTDGVFRMQPPEQWPKKASSLKKVEQLYNSLDARISKDYYDKARMGEISYLEAEKFGQIAVVKELCRQCGIRFEFEPWDKIWRK